MPSLSSETLQHHLESMSPAIQRDDLDSLQEDRFVACVDGRNREPVAAVPGGNAGLFVLMLAALSTTSSVAPQDIDGLLDAYLDRFQSFYLHSDTAAVTRLFEALASAEVGADLPDPPEAQADLLRQPPAELQEVLRDRLGDPEYVGCGHLRLVLERPEDYEISRPLVEAMVEGFFQRLWAGDDRCHFDVLVGSHQEEGVVRLASDDASLPPLLTPQYQGRQLFVYHPAVVQFMQQQHAAFLQNQDLLSPANIDAFQKAHDRLANSHLHLTLTALAPDLPVYDVRWEEQGPVVSS